VSAAGGYENAPATIMLATQCAVCGRPLVDSVSVETGIGPECRKKHGYNIVVAPEARAEANALVHQVALDQGGLSVARAAARLRELGFEVLSAVLLKRACPVRIDEIAGRLVVKSPYNENATASFRRIPGRRWDGEQKVNTFPVEARRSLFGALVSAYAGLVAYGPKGAFVLNPSNDNGGK
jgi:hypothetical protein